MLTEERSKGWGMAEQRGSKVERYLPLIYFAVALVLVIAVLPTVLRPPQQQPHQSAELSPDAPPDKDQQSIISSLGRGQSATAGSGAGVGAGGRRRHPSDDGGDLGGYDAMKAANIKPADGFVFGIDCDPEACCAVSQTALMKPPFGTESSIQIVSEIDDGGATVGDTHSLPMRSNQAWPS